MTNSEHFEEVMLKCFYLGIQEKAFAETAQSKSLEEAIPVLEALIESVAVGSTE